MSRKPNYRCISRGSLDFPRTAIITKQQQLQSMGIVAAVANRYRYYNLLGRMLVFRRWGFVSLAKHIYSFSPFLLWLLRDMFVTAEGRCLRSLGGEEFFSFCLAP